MGLLLVLRPKPSRGFRGPPEGCFLGQESQGKSLGSSLIPQGNQWAECGAHGWVRIFSGYADAEGAPREGEMGARAHRRRATAARLGLGVVPSRNPCLNLRYTIFRCLIRPVPVVFRLLALALQLYFLFRLAG